MDRQGHRVKADTLEELADGLKLEGAHKEAFLATIERYNELYDAQEDVDFGKEPYLLSQIRTAPFYGVTLAEPCSTRATACASTPTCRCSTPTPK